MFLSSWEGDAAACERDCVWSRVPSHGNGAVEMELSKGGGKHQAELPVPIPARDSICFRLQGKAWDWVLAGLSGSVEGSGFHCISTSQRESVLCAVGRADSPLPFSSTEVFPVAFFPFEAQNSIPGTFLGCCALISPALVWDVWQGLVRASYIHLFSPWLIPTNADAVGGSSLLFSQQENPVAALL